MLPRNYNIDLLKLISCVAVVGLHTLCGTQNPIYNIGYLLCGFAIPSFMLASGYLLFLSGDFTWGDSVKKIKKCIRFILSWIAVSIAIKGIGVFVINEKTDVVYWMQVIFSPFLNEGLMWHFWYIAALIIIYALFPLFILMKKRGILLRCWIVFVFICATLYIYSLMTGQSIQKNIPQYLRIWTWVQYVLLGGVLHQFLQNDEKVLALHKNMGTKVKLVFSFYTIAYIIWQLFVLNHISDLSLAEVFYDDLLEMIWIILLFTMVFSIKLGDKITYFIKSAAPLTFGVYIIHPFVMKVTSKIAMGEPAVLWIATVLASFLIVAVLVRIPLLKKLIVF